MYAPRHAGTGDANMGHPSDFLELGCAPITGALRVAGVPVVPVAGLADAAVVPAGVAVVAAAVPVAVAGAPGEFVVVAAPAGVDAPVPGVPARLASAEEFAGQSALPVPASLLGPAAVGD